MKSKLLNYKVSNYKSKSQIARVVTETWGSNNLFCPICGNKRLMPHKNNHKVSDFYCNKCKEEFQLKSSSKKFGKQLIGSDYYTFSTKLKNNEQPNLFLLNYNLDDNVVNNLVFIPKVFITFNNVIKRPPLKSNAKRAGWTGYNLRLDLIPEEGKIVIIADKDIKSTKKIISKVQNINNSYNGYKTQSEWNIAMLKLIKKMDTEFTLSDMYKYENRLSNKFPNNNNIKDKIRQQLQILRDNGIIYFIDKGSYKKVE